VIVNNLNLSDIIGQPSTISLLQRVIEKQRPSHAYLFHGPEAVGRTSTAFAFAKSLLCQKPLPNGDACNNCISCHKMLSGNHPDFRLVGIQRGGSAGSDGDRWRISIDQIRQNPGKPRVTPPPMITDAYYHPVDADWKVYIIEPADLLTEQAANALLKLLEEPPAYVVIILITSRAGFLLPTLRSRCWGVNFRLAAREDIYQALLAKGVEQQQAKLFAALSEGRVGWAMANVGSDAIDSARRETIELLSQVATSRKAEGLRLAEDLCEIARQAHTELQTETEETDASGMSGERFMRTALPLILDLGISWYRDLLLTSQHVDDLIANDDYRELLAEQADLLGLERIKTGIITLLETRRNIQRYANSALATESLILKLQG